MHKTLKAQNPPLVRGSFLFLTDTMMKEINKAKTGLIYTKTVESGAFIRTQYRKEDKTKTKTERMTKNQKKVILSHIGDFEVYVYPYDYPDTVFIGKFPISTKIDKNCINQLFSAYNKARTFLNGDYFSKAKTTKEAQMRRHSIQRAYSYGLNEQRSKK